MDVFWRTAIKQKQSNKGRRKEQHRVGSGDEHLHSRNMDSSQVFRGVALCVCVGLGLQGELSEPNPSLACCNCGLIK